MKKNRILQPGDDEFLQLGLFSAPNTGQTRLADYPEVFRDEGNFKRVAMEAEGMLGLDFEFNTSTLVPTVIGISNWKEAASIWCTPEIISWLDSLRRQRGLIYSGHAVLTADRQVLEKALGTSTHLSDWSDSMLTFWLANADLCKNPGKEVDEEGGLGFMGLGTMVSLTTDLPHHKTCRGKNCEELICPRHDVRGYCAIDAYGGLLGDRKSREDLQAYGVPENAVRFIHRLADLSQRMTEMGVRVDREYVKTLGASMEADQEKLFGGPDAPFNPRSPKAVLAWCRDHKIFLTSTDKDAVQTAVEKLAAAEGFTGDRFEEVRDQLDNAENLDPTLKTMYDLYTYKVLGKGTDSWFHDRYFGKDGLLHPRFPVTGTSTGRLSSSRPNYQNIPKRGWGKKLRGAFVPNDPDSYLVEADFSQLELRVCLYLAGIDQRIIGADAFTWLVQQSGGLFEKAAERYGGKPRDIAKSISHAADYLEGLKLIDPKELYYPRFSREVEVGALRIYHPQFMDDCKEEWTYMGKVVAFTGANLAQRLFGDKSYANRKKALEIQEDIYFKAFPGIRDWHRRALASTEDSRCVKAPTGRFLRLNDTPEKNAKITAAALGQGVGAAHVQSVMLEYDEKFGQIFMGQIHDALLGSFPKAGGFKAIYDRMKHMEMETSLLPGFHAPVKIEVGERWNQMKELHMEDGQLFWGDEKVS